jgi:hypothetical protein
MKDESGNVIPGTAPEPDVKREKTGKPSMTWGAILTVLGVAWIVLQGTGMKMSVENLVDYFGALIVPTLLTITGIAWFIVGVFERKAWLAR